MAKLNITHEKCKNGIMVNMTCTDKEDYISTDILPPDDGCNMKGKLFTKISFIVKNGEMAKKIINEKKEAVNNLLQKYRESVLPQNKTITI